MTTFDILLGIGTALVTGAALLVWLIFRAASRFDEPPRIVRHHDPFDG